MSDLIKREDAIKAVSIPCGTCLARNIEDCEKCSVPKLRELINAIPSVGRPQGEWIYCEDYVGHDGYECSNCGFFIPWVYDYYADSNFILNYHTCPHCDARMKEQKITE